MKEFRLFAGLSRLVTRHPKFVLGALVCVSLALAFQLPHLTADPSPRALLASADPGQAKADAEARALFGSTDNVIVVVIGSGNVLREGPLGLAHRVASELERMPGVERVDSLTRLIWPKVVEDTGTLDDLQGDPGEEPMSPELLAAATDLVAAAPDVFPLGLASLSERSAGTKLEPIVTGSEVRAADVALIRDAVHKAPQLTGRLISKDRKHLIVAAQFPDSIVKHEDMERVVRRLEDFLERRAKPPAGVSVALSGLPVVRSSLVRHMRADQRVLIPGTLIASLIVLSLSFRWWPAVVLPVISVGITALWLLGLMAFGREPLNVLNNMLPALVIIIGLNEAVHIIGRYIEDSARYRDKPRALTETVSAMGAACLMTTLTSAVGLLALLVSRTEMLRRFGLVGALGLVLAYAVTLLLVPACLSLLETPPRTAERTDKRGRIELYMSRTTTAALRSPKLVLSVALVSTLVAAFLSERVVVDSTLLDQFSKSDAIYQTARILEQDFEGVRPLEVTLSSDQPGRFFEPGPLDAAHRVARWAGHQTGVLRVSDPTEPLSSGWAALSGRPLDVRDATRSSSQVRALSSMLRARDPRIMGPVLTADGKKARIRVKLADIGSRATGHLVTALGHRVHTELAPFSDVKVSFGGDAYVSSRGLDAVVSDLSGSVLTAALVIFALLAILLRDARLALLAIPANLLPQVWTLAWMVLRDIPLNASSAIIFSLSIGLSVDGSIHLVSRFQEERARGVLITSALVRAVRGTGRSIVVSSGALMLGFSVMLLSRFVPVQRFAELIGVSMAGCVFATLVIQPVLLRLFAARVRRARPAVEPVTGASDLGSP